MCKVTTFSYDAFNNLINVKDPLNQNTSYTYDLNGNMLSMTDGKANVTKYLYTNLNQLAFKIAPGGVLPNGTIRPSKTESYTYLDNGIMTSKTDRKGVLTNYSYDIHGRLISETAGAELRTYTYENKGNQISATDTGSSVTRQYDALDRVTKKQVTGLAATTIKYDVTAGMATGYTSEVTTDPKGNVTTRVFDKAGRLYQLSGTGSGTITYAYFANGNKQSVSYPGNVTAEYT